MAKRKLTTSGKLIIAVLFVLAVLLVYLLLTGGGGGEVVLAEPVSVTIAEGSSTQAIAEKLADEGLINSKRAFVAYVRSEGLAVSLKAGEYLFEGTVTIADIAQKIAKGSSAASDLKVTIPEGWTVKQTAQAFADKGICTVDEFIDYCQNADFSYDYLPAKGTASRLEGFLFPETYMVAKGWEAPQVVDMLLRQFDKVYNKEMRSRCKEMGYSTLELVTMASLVEKEAVWESDRALISGVFYNRLQKGMLLQSCATVQYILGEPKYPLLFRDLEIDDPYNTYIYPGLPPGPIASPGEACLQAALYPEETDYLYFLAKPNGEHYFSKTLAEHNKAYEKYIKQ
ncbi:MAG: endolytic transglycosylase MltG [Clostridia bacterium]|nr:endolytic transglycosylase MltG [Clostridia bacterium]